jgi:hypothetical protein
MSSKLIPKSIRTEMKTVESMIRIFCADEHMQTELCPKCAELIDYAFLRLEYCRFGANKPTCIKCPVHCYKSDMKDRIRNVMRNSGPKMLFKHPWLALMHLWKERGLFQTRVQVE